MPLSCTLGGVGSGRCEERFWALGTFSGRRFRRDYLGKVKVWMEMLSFIKPMLTFLQGCLFPILKTSGPNHSPGWIRIWLFHVPPPPVAVENRVTVTRSCFKFMIVDFTWVLQAAHSHSRFPSHLFMCLMAPLESASPKGLTCHQRS